jgi:hypothetical protein
MNWLARFWDFIDKRGIDKHVVSMAVMWGTVKITEWSMTYANTHADAANSVGIAAIIGAVSGPYMALQAAAIKFYFDARSNS